MANDTFIFDYDYNFFGNKSHDFNHFMIL